MAKSLGNFVTVKNFIKEHKHPDILKLFFLSCHYLHPIDYSEDKIQDAEKQKKSFDSFFRSTLRLREVQEGSAPGLKVKEQVDFICGKFIKAMDDNFNTPEALGCLFELRDLSLGSEGRMLNYGKLKARELFQLFGLEVKEEFQLPKEEVEKERQRDIDRENRNFKEADLKREEFKKNHRMNPSDTSIGTIYIDEQ
jgi:cysteinyl-tRNA synthetase